jgi:hypothetical protein
MTVVVENTGPTRWPCTGIRRAHRVALSVGWLRSDGRDAEPPMEVLLSHDLRPGARVESLVWTTSPTEPGEYRLHLSVAQRTAAGDRGSGGLESDELVTVVAR